MNMILHIAVPSPLRQTFDYLPPANCDHADLQIGKRALVTFGRQKLIGLIVGITNKSSFDETKLKPITALLDNKPILPSTILELINWASNYYHHPIGDVVANALPALLRDPNKIISDQCIAEILSKTCKKNNEYNQCVTKNEDKIQLNTHQQEAIKQILDSSNTFKTFSLHGVTGSGKTEVYLQVINELIQNGKQALILVPEINLTPQTIGRFAARFQVPIAVMHSRLTNKQRLASWHQAQTGKAPIIIGTRSAIFTPLKTPGIIILDEEHDLSFKQQAGLRYSARDLAIIRGKIESIPIVLGSATPSFETLHNAQQKRFVQLTLPERAGKAIHPSFHLVDMRNQKLKDGIAENLLKKIAEHLAQKNQILVFLNRRGFAPVLLCHTCGWNAQCKNCDARMTFHQKQKLLHCHHCGSTKRMPTQCPNCGSINLTTQGAGTERIELSLQKHFPEAKLVRIDRDTTRRKGSIQQILSEVHQDNYQILVGTQMLAKGHHFPNVTLVAILNVDNGLLSADFRASEHTAQLIMQVAGRAGRAEKPGEVFIQTHNPQHPLLLKLINEGFSEFATQHLLERKVSELPPFAYLAIIRAESKQQNAALQFLTEVRKLCDLNNNRLQMFGPIPSVMERRAGFFRAQLLIQSNDRITLHKKIEELLKNIETLKPKSSIKWHLDIDPVDLL